MTLLKIVEGNITEVRKEVKDLKERNKVYGKGWANGYIVATPAWLKIPDRDSMLLMDYDKLEDLDRKLKGYITEVVITTDRLTIDYIKHGVDKGFTEIAPVDCPHMYKELKNIPVIEVA